MTLYFEFGLALALLSSAGVTKPGMDAPPVLTFGPAFGLFARAPIGAHNATASARTTSRATPPVRLPHSALPLVPSPDPGVQPAFGPRRSEFTMILLLSRIHAGPQ